MGFFSFLSGRKGIPATESERIKLVRSLLAKRISRDPASQLSNLLGGRSPERDPEAVTFMGTPIGEMEPVMVMAMPEASIMRIVEQYHSAKEQGAPDYVVIPFLNQSHAQALSAAGQSLSMMRQPYSLQRYVTHFVEEVHGSNFFDMAFIPEAINEVERYYGRIRDP